mmetsp:Transcript_70440/g.199769  ORF Transcript_70440/g.199769 Transcript_70440/m.199769 type:complete len:300 (+) Transcript_70440:486-1385(+)
MPSHATMRNSSPASRLNVTTSGVEHIICSAGDSCGFFLYCKSPIERDRFKLPFTRNCTVGPTCCRYTEPPALRMRSLSAGRLGLWSSESGTAWRERESTARLSPVFATTIASGRTRQTTQVQPTQSGLAACGSGPSCSRPPPRDMERKNSPLCFSSPSFSSMRWKAATSAPRASSAEPLAISGGKCLSQNFATSLPPCPSITPKAAVSTQPMPSRAGMAKWASSIWTRQPCIQLWPQMRPFALAWPSPESFAVTGAESVCPMPAGPGSLGPVASVHGRDSRIMGTSSTLAPLLEPKCTT